MNACRAIVRQPTRCRNRAQTRPESVVTQVIPRVEEHWELAWRPSRTLFKGCIARCSAKTVCGQKSGAFESCIQLRVRTPCPRPNREGTHPNLARGRPDQATAPTVLPPTRRWVSLPLPEVGQLRKNQDNIGDIRPNPTPLRSRRTGANGRLCGGNGKCPPCRGGFPPRWNSFGDHERVEETEGCKHIRLVFFSIRYESNPFL